jgi:hypothetical protein
MPKTPKIGTKYDDDDLDATFQGQSSSEATQTSDRVTRSKNPRELNEPSQSDHDADNTGDDSFNSALNSETNLSSTILEISSSESSPSSPNSHSNSSPKSHSSQHSAMTEDEIKKLIETSVEQRLRQYEANNSPPTANAPKFHHAPKISNIPQLTITNYSDWAMKIKAAMLLKELWIDPSILPSQYDSKLKDTSQRAVQFIVLHLDESNNDHVNETNEKCFYTVWKNLKEILRKSPNHSMLLCDFYCSLQHIIHQTDECVRTHLMKIEHQFNKLANNVENQDMLSENHKVAIVLASIRKSAEFSRLFDSAKWLKTETLTFAVVKDTIISAQDQLRMDSHHHVENKGLKPTHFNESHLIEIKSDTNIAKSLMNYRFNCFNTLYQPQTIVVNKGSEKISSWIIDSGASIHMCHDSSILESFRSHQGQFATISNGVSIPITGFGDLTFTISDSNNFPRSEKCRMCSAISRESIIGARFDENWFHNVQRRFLFHTETS